MKAKRLILIISGIICILFILFSIFTQNGTKINNICIGIMGSSIVSFAITLPDYFCEKNRIKSKMYLLSIALYRNMLQIEFNLNVALTKNEIILENFLEFSTSNVEKKSFVLPLHIQAEGNVTNVGYVNQKVKVIVKVSESDIANVASSDFYAYVNLNYVETSGTYNIPVHVNVSDKVMAMNPLEVRVEPEYIAVSPPALAAPGSTPLIKLELPPLPTTTVYVPAGSRMTPLNPAPLPPPACTFEFKV